ncbi:MAG: hypothetical protein JWP69_1555 [Flaviaesturariibacter sp.]|nr:hypothetical protein [Flaviaesturariibacter sp.]
MKQTTHPNFILGLISLLLLFVGVFMRMNAYRGGDYVLIGTMILGGIHWIWSIVDVFKQQNLASQSRVLWGILIICVPPVGGLLYYAMSKTVRM